MLGLSVQARGIQGPSWNQEKHSFSEGVPIWTGFYNSICLLGLFTFSGSFCVLVRTPNIIEKVLENCKVRIWEAQTRNRNRNTRSSNAGAKKHQQHPTTNFTRSAKPDFTAKKKSACSSSNYAVGGLLGWLFSTYIQNSSQCRSCARGTIPLSLAPLTASCLVKPPAAATVCTLT